MAYTLQELADKTCGEIRGDKHCLIKGVASLADAKAGDITFLTNPAYRKYLPDTQASSVILKEKDARDCKVNALVVENPYAVFARIAQILYPKAGPAAGIHGTAVVDKSSTIHASAQIESQCVIGANVSIAANVKIGPGCVIDDDVIIGEDSVLAGNVTLMRATVLGKRALIHAGVVIGADGFGFANDQGEWIKIPQLGKVRIGDDVEVGANTTIDRGAIDDTHIEQGVKLDNQIQIGHNVRIGAHTLISACSAIAGSTKIGKRCTIGGGVGIINNLMIADDVTITGGTVVMQSILEPGLYSSGTPMEENRQWRKNFTRMKQLDEMSRRLAKLEKSK